MMTCVIGADVEARKSGLPENDALMECDPTGSELIAKPGAKVWLAGMTAIGFTPSRNVTMPLGKGPAGVICVLNVTGVPKGTDDDDEVTTVVLAAGLTVMVSGAELLAPFVPSPK